MQIGLSEHVFFCEVVLAGGQEHPAGLPGVGEGHPGAQVGALGEEREEVAGEAAADRAGGAVMAGAT